MLALTLETMACVRSESCSDLILYVYFICTATCVRALVHLPLQVTQGRDKNICFLASLKLAAQKEAEILQMIVNLLYCRWSVLTYPNLRMIKPGEIPSFWDKVSAWQFISGEDPQQQQHSSSSRNMWGKDMFMINVNIHKHLEIMLKWKYSLEIIAFLIYFVMFWLKTVQHFKRI